MKYQFPIEEQKLVYELLTNICQVIDIDKERRRAINNLCKKFSPNAKSISLNAAESGLFLAIMVPFLDDTRALFDKMNAGSLLNRLKNKVIKKRRQQLYFYAVKLALFESAVERVVAQHGTN